jgi:hypothetical protein
LQTFFANTETRLKRSGLPKSKLSVSLSTQRGLRASPAADVELLSEFGA